MRVIFLGLLVGCSSGGREGSMFAAVSEREPEAEVRALPEAEPVSAVPVSEIQARVLFAQKFREAGFRVRYDVQVSEPGRFELTVDGYDPAQRVGFEYIAAGEEGTDVTRAERAELAAPSNYRLLVVDAMAGGSAVGIEALGAAADEFLQAVRR